MTPAALAVDAGQTEIRAALTDGARPAHAPPRPACCAWARATGPDEVAAGLLAAVAGLGALPTPPPPAGIGLSGFEAASEEDLRRVHELLRRELGLERVAIASDGLTSLLGALGDRPGAVVAAGTGAVCVARHGERMAKVDGWGSLLGDAGSGFAIGRAGLDAALRQADGRGGSPALLAAAERRFGPAPALAERIYGSAGAHPRGGQLRGRRRARGGRRRRARPAILRDAARELALSACAALERLFDPGEEAAVSYAGNVFLGGPGAAGAVRRGRCASAARGPRSWRPRATRWPARRCWPRGPRTLRPEPRILWRAA